MTVTVDLPEDALARLRAVATRRGVSIDLAIAELTKALPAVAPPDKRARQEHLQTAGLAVLQLSR